MALPGSRVASNYDITFLRLLMEQQLTEKPQAMRCLQVIDEQAQRGQPVNAAQVAVRMGLVNQEIGGIGPKFNGALFRSIFARRLLPGFRFHQTSHTLLGYIGFAGKKPPAA